MSGYERDNYCSECNKLLYKETNIYDGKYHSDVRKFFTLNAVQKEDEVYCICGERYKDFWESLVGY